jgi:hypothetical protein
MAKNITDTDESQVSKSITNIVRKLKQVVKDEKELKQIEEQSELLKLFGKNYIRHI